MTQKEYKEHIAGLEYEIKILTKELEAERMKIYNYEQTLVDYHRVSEELRREIEWKRQDEVTIEQQRRVIERYEKILDKFTINY